MSFAPGGDARPHHDRVTWPARFGEGVDKRRQCFSGECSGAPVDEKMVRDQIRLHARDSIELFQCMDDGLLRRTAAGAGQRQSRTFSGKDLGMT